MDPTKFAKQGICYKGFVSKDMPGQNITQARSHNSKSNIAFLAIPDT